MTLKTGCTANPSENRNSNPSVSALCRLGFYLYKKHLIVEHSLSYDSCITINHVWNDPMIALKALMLIGGWIALIVVAHYLTQLWRKL